MDQGYVKLNVTRRSQHVFDAQRRGAHAMGMPNSPKSICRSLIVQRIRYKHTNKLKKSDHVAAAAYRNSSFLVVPQKPRQISVPRSLSRGISKYPLENRSFQYFQMHTLPSWTEFFESELWSRKIMQLSHIEPAIKHGLLALSTMHERYDTAAPAFQCSSNDFAFNQYMQAVKHSNNLLQAHEHGKVDLEKILVACIIFTCYENLAGNFQAACMHLQNGLRILDQNKHDGKARTNAWRNTIENVLYRFDLQAMTFSDNSTGYQFVIESIPDCPTIPVTYKSNDAARDDIVRLLRCTMWISGCFEKDPQSAENRSWRELTEKSITSFGQWETAFARYQKNMSLCERDDPKVYAGNTLLRMSAIMFNIIMGSYAGPRTEMSWDPFVDSFKEIVDLAETLPTLTQLPVSSPSTSSPSPTQNQPRSRAVKGHSRLPDLGTTLPALSLHGDAFMFCQDDLIVSSAPEPSLADNPHNEPQHVTQTPSRFSPSFELSPIVPLFVVGCRCRDPILRRRAIKLLLNCRRREGVWDSLAAGMVASQCLKREEDLDISWDPTTTILPLNPKIRECQDVPEWRRVRDIYVNVKTSEGKVNLVYSMTLGTDTEKQIIYESRGDMGTPSETLMEPELLPVSQYFLGTPSEPLEFPLPYRP
jgi:hypothetical protein